MLYYKKDIARRVKIHPRYFGTPGIKKVVRKALRQDIRTNSFSIEHGYVVERVEVKSIKDGHLLPLSGFAEFMVTFDAIVLYPVQGEVVDAVVELVTETCIIFRHVCMFGVVRAYSLCDLHYYEYEEIEVTSRSGLVTKEGSFKSKTDEEKVIRKGSVVRLRITNRTVGGNGFFLVGSMSGEYLGPLKNPPPEPLTGNALEWDAEDTKKVLSKLEVNEGVIPSPELKKIKGFWGTEKPTYSKNQDTDEDDNASVASLTLD